MVILLGIMKEILSSLGANSYVVTQIMKIRLKNNLSRIDLLYLSPLHLLVVSRIEIFGSLQTLINFSFSISLFLCDLCSLQQLDLHTSPWLPCSFVQQQPPVPVYNSLPVHQKSPSSNLCHCNIVWKKGYPFRIHGPYTIIREGWSASHEVLRIISTS